MREERAGTTEDGVSQPPRAVSTRIRRCVAGGLWCLLVVSGARAYALPAPVYWPRRGVVCDPVNHFCAGPRGVSPWLTGRFPGPAARATLADMTGDNPGRDMTRFTLSDGVWCDAGSAVCWFTGKDARPHISQEVTHALFGQ
ncbi:YcgJ family protein [Klebsiella aerogenes]|uniref:YcgJ family protein n=1 Tax=Klebsiella aerogenes TaxID=548 RepID=UPI003A939F5F